MGEEPVRAATGGFIWYELMTPDAESAARFYGPVVGWTIGANQMPDGGIDYHAITRSDGGYAAGLLALNDEMMGGGARPGWLGYVHVPDVDAEIAAFVAEGGTLVMPATTLESIGRIAMVTDPFGAPLYLMTPRPPAGNPNAASDVFSIDRPQTVRWNELCTPDDEAAIAFYGRRFGWTQEGAIPMGPLGEYRFLQNGGTAIGAVMKQADFMQAGWTFYFGVEDIDDALAAVRANGGDVRGEPRQVPGGEFTFHAVDPQGAAFGLVGPRSA